MSQSISRLKAIDEAMAAGAEGLTKKERLMLSRSGQVQAGDAYYIDHVPIAYQRYRKRSFVLGKMVNVLTGDKSTPARALDVDDHCRLVVEYEDGRREALSSGEISVKLL